MFKFSIKKYFPLLIFTFLVTGGLFFVAGAFSPEEKKIEIALFEGPKSDFVFGSPIGACGGSCPCGQTCTGGKFPTCTCDSCVAVTASLSASPTSIDFGDSSTLTWSSSGDVSSCSGSGFSTGGATSGSTSVSPESDTTYTVTCTGAGGTDSDTTTVIVSDPPPPPTANLLASPTLISNGNSSTLTWSTSGGEATSCSGSGFSTGGAISGSTDVSPSVDTTYFLTCTGPGGSDGDTADVDVSNPSAPPEIDADPDRVERGDTTSLSWDTNGHLGCSISGTNGDSFDPEVVSSPQTTGAVFGETTFTILCTDDSSSDDVDVTIIPEFEEF